MRGRHDEVALVLAIVIIRYHHKLAAADRFDCVDDRGRRRGCFPPPFGAGGTEGVGRRSIAEIGRDQLDFARLDLPRTLEEPRD